MYIVVIKTDSHLYRIKMEEGKKITIGTGEKDAYQIPELNEGRLELFFTEGTHALTLKGKKIQLSTKNLPDACRMVQVCDLPKLEVRWSEDAGEYDTFYPITYDCQIHIGRSHVNDVVLHENFVSRRHLVITSEKGEIRAEDLDSTNGTYLNGSKFKKAMLKSGDVLDILELRIRCVNNRLYFENLHEMPELHMQAVISQAGKATDFADPDKGYLRYHRSPRVREALPQNEVTLSHLPNKVRKFTGRKSGFLSILSSGAMAGASLAVGSFSPAMLAMRAAMMISPVGSMISGSNRKARTLLRVEEEERFKKYADYITGEKAHIEAIGTKQSEIINRENPTPEACQHILSNLTTALWERNPADSDFLQVRMGAGYAPLCVEVKPPSDVNDFHMERDELEEMTGRIIQETRLVDNVPARADLLKYSSVGIVGTRHKVIDLVKNMIVCLTALHYYKQVRIVGVFDHEEQEQWQALRWLPHIWDEDQQTRYLNFDELTEDSLKDTPLEESSKRVDPYRKFREKIDSLLAERADPEFQKKWKNESTPIPHYVFIFGSRQKTEPFLKALSANDPTMGISTIFLYDEQYYLPNFCQYIVNVDDSYDDRTATGFYKDTANDKMWFTMDPPLPEGSFDAFCRRMSAVEVDDAASKGQIPSSVTFLQCFGAQRVQDLHVLETWKKNSSAAAVAAPLGEAEGGRKFRMSLHRHCSHGLVAGMTGSGKSELLISWILSMACCYHPQDVSFVVIDYKGGSTAYAVEKLPHVAGIITDSGAGIDRCFRSLEHELRRREELFADSGVSDIKAYIDGFHRGVFKEAVPRLIIVFDEFKELIKERPAVKKMVDSIAAKGSSLGVHLVLATQSPADAVDEGTWNNTQYQICMKVQNAAASKVMIHEPDAAMITQTGRAYVRVGTSEKAEIFELIQSAWSGAPYNEDGDRGSLEVRMVLMNGERVKTVEENKTRFVSSSREIDAVVSYIERTAKAAGIEGIPSPWKPEIPSQFALDDMKLPGGFDGMQWRDPETPWLSIPVGFYDRPELQDQGILRLDFAREGNLGIFGGSRTGKTSLLRTLAVSLCRSYTPAEVNLYIIGDLSGLQAFPQVGGVVSNGQDEKFMKLMRMLQDILQDRRQKFGAEGVDSLKSYRELVSEDMTAVFVLIDRFSGVLESFQDSKDTFVKLFSEGPSKGIYFVYTGVNNTGVPYKLTSNVAGAISFLQTDRSEYSTLIGQVGDHTLPVEAGDGLIRQPSGLLGFHAALYESGQNDKEREQNLKAEAERMTAVWKGDCAPKIPVLPDYISMEEMIQLTASSGQLVLGYQAETIQPAGIDPTQTDAIAVMGRSGCGKTRMLCTIGRIAKAARPDTMLFCMDTDKKGLYKLTEIGAEYALISDEAGISEMFKKILTELNRRMLLRQSNVQSDKEEPWILLLLDDIKKFVGLSDEIQMHLHRIIQKAQGLGMLVFCGIRQSDMFNFYTQDQLGVDLKQTGTALALSETAAHYEGCYKNNFLQKDRSAELQVGFGLLYSNDSCVKIKCVEGTD